MGNAAKNGGVSLVMLIKVQYNYLQAISKYP
jgi:hypothetical protein